MTRPSVKCYVIPIRYRCSAECPFCITKSYRPAEIREALRPDQTFGQSVASAGAAGAHVFEFTGGGEPTLNRHLDALIRAVRSGVSQSRVKLYTNGAHLVQVSGVDEVNISRAALGDSANASAMKFRKPPPPLVDMVAHWRERGATRVRLSVALTRGGIDTPGKLYELVEHTHDFVDAYVVRPLYPGTQLMTALYVRPFIDFAHPTVELDLESCASRPNLVLGSDGRLYEDFALSTPVASGARG